MTFGATVERCQWIEETKRWRLYVRRADTDTVFVHESQFLFSGAGQLVYPRDIDVPGAESFNGTIFHSSRWRPDVDLTDKRVVVIGNGCTAAQIVPSIVGQTKHLTQVVRSKHWIRPAIDAESIKALQLLKRYVPGTMTIQRFIVFCVAENAWRGFYMTDAAARFRRSSREETERYMRATAPEKYHDLVIPDFEFGCKRRIYDSGYLACLHAENLTLTDKPVLEIVPGGVRTADGVIDADVIVLANGFATNRFLAGVEVVGSEGKTIDEHWDSFGGPEAYNNTVLSGFPNFFLLLGKLGPDPPVLQVRAGLLLNPRSRSEHGDRPHLNGDGHRKRHQLLPAHHQAHPGWPGKRHRRQARRRGAPRRTDPEGPEEQGVGVRLPQLVREGRRRRGRQDMERHDVPVLAGVLLVSLPVSRVARFELDCRLKTNRNPPAREVRRPIANATQGPATRKPGGVSRKRVSLACIILAAGLLLSARRRLGSFSAMGQVSKLALARLGSSVSWART